MCSYLRAVYNSAHELCRQKGCQSFIHHCSDCGSLGNSLVQYSCSACARLVPEFDELLASCCKMLHCVSFRLNTQNQWTYTSCGNVCSLNTCSFRLQSSIAMASAWTRVGNVMLLDYVVCDFGTSTFSELLETCAPDVPHYCHDWTAALAAQVVWVVLIRTWTQRRLIDRWHGGRLGSLRPLSPCLPSAQPGSLCLVAWHVSVLFNSPPLVGFKFVVRVLLVVSACCW